MRPPGRRGWFRNIAVGMVASTTFVTIVIGPAGPAWAPPGDGSGATGSGGIIFDGQPAVWAGYTERPRPVIAPSTSGTAAHYWCALWIPPLGGDGSGIGNFDIPETRERNPTEGGLYLLQCFTRAGEHYGVQRLVFFEPRNPSDGTITTRADVVEYAIDLLPLTAPAVATQPPALRLVTGFETWITIAPAGQPQTRSAQAGQFWATAEARPTRIRVDTGDGTLLDCALPVMLDSNGRPTCARHTYLDTRRAPAADGRFTMTASITYEVWVTTDRGGPVLFDTRQGPTTAFDVQSRDVQAVLR
ncbi:MAG TPA: hypothetical protein VM282_20255 [Acidimicrobiales bacterium]|nr:hypothetical protein [Acidimicrobiales bacterium]